MEHQALMELEQASDPSLSDRLEAILKANTQHRISLAEMVDTIGVKSFGVLILLLSMPSALPLPAPGYSTPLGILIMFLAIQMAIGRRRPWIPEKTQKVSLKRSTLAKMLFYSVKFLRKTEHLIKPRFTFLCGHKGSMFFGLLIFLLALVMAAPIPFTNTVPAMAIFFIAMGLVECDGLFCILGTVFGLVVLGVYVYALYLFLVYGMSALTHFKDAVIDLFRF